MYFANPWGLLGLLALPAIAAIHLFHQRFPPLLVAGAHLWGAETRVTTAGRRRDRLPVSLSLILELLATLLLTAALSEPKIGDVDEVAHLIAVLDDSASMSSHAAGAPSPRELAIADLERRSLERGRGTLLTLIRTGPQPTLIGRRGMSWNDAQAALAEWQPRSGHHAHELAWDEAVQIAGATGGFVYFTDTVPDAAALPAAMELVALGRPLNNAAISAARWSFDSAVEQGRVFLRIANIGQAELPVQVTGRSSDAIIFQQMIPLPAGNDVPLEVDVPGGLGELTIEITTDGDGLEADNKVVLIEPETRVVTLAVTFPEGDESAELVRRVLSALPDLQFGPVEEAHAIIGPAADLPASRPELWWLGIGPLSTDAAALQSAETVTGPFILDKQHPLLEGVTLDGVIWSGAQPIELAVTPLVTFDRLPLLAQLAGTESRAYVLNVDLPASNLPRTPDWPILLANLIEMRRAALPGLQRWNYRTDEVVRLLSSPPAQGQDGLELSTPSGRLRPLIRDRQHIVEITGLDETGIYRTLQLGVETERFAVNFFDPDESDLSSLSSGRRTPSAQYEPTRLRIDDPYSWLIVLAVLLALAAILSNWYSLRPGRPARDATSSR